MSHQRASFQDVRFLAYLSGIQRYDKRLFINQSTSRGIHDHHAVFHLVKLPGGYYVPGGLVQRQVETQDIGQGQQVVKGNISGVSFELWGES